jgi:two-component system alkaline phosphatase synthesis response regulator PhoP
MSKKILVVDDDDSILELLTLVLEEAGYTVVTAGEGMGALKKVAANGFSAVLLDYMMPGADGLQVASQLRELGKKVPVIIVTAFDSLNLRKRAEELGIIDVLSKPFEPEHLLKKLHSAVNGETVHFNQQ